MTDQTKADSKKEGFFSQLRRFRRNAWENLAVAIIAAGVFMLMQGFLLELFTYSFVTILTGTVMFIIVSHFPE